MSTVVATYNYTDEDGTILYQTLRYEPKDFRQRRPDGKGGWLWGLAGVRRVLYHLPQLHAAPGDQPVFVTEGEKDADSLAALGLLATTSPLGAGKWRPEYGEALHGRHVVILPDNDEPGRRHARQVADALLGVAASVKVLALPGLADKGDVSDWLLAGGGACEELADELLSLARRAPVYVAPASGVSVSVHTPIGEYTETETVGAHPYMFPPLIPSSQLQHRDDQTRWVWEGCLAVGTISLLAALWKVGKSTLLAHLLKALSGEPRFCGLAVQPARVLYISEEPEDLWADRRDAIGFGDHVHFLLRPFTCRPDFAQWDRFLAHLRSLRGDFPFDLLIMDTISNLWPVRDENDNSQVGGALMPLWSLGRDLSVLLNHHLRKGDGPEATAARGAGAMAAFVDTILELRRYDPAQRKDRRRVLTGYGRFRQTPEELVVELSDDGSGYLASGDRQDTVRVELSGVLDGLLPNAPPGLTVAEVIDDWPGDATPRKTALLAALGQGVDGGRYRRDGRGVRGSPFTYWISMP